MQNLWSDADAKAAIAQHAKKGIGEDLALRVYTTRLLGGEPKLVLHGGGNTSVKTRVADATGEPVEVLCVKGSGWDMGTIEAPGLPAVRLAPLGGLAAGLGLVALAGRLGFGPNLAPVLMLLVLGVLLLALALVLAARRARSSSVPAARYTELWQGIGGPSYAPRPATVRVDTRPVGSSAARSGAPAVVRAIAISLGPR